MLEIRLDTVLMLVTGGSALFAGFQFTRGGKDQALLDAMDETPTSPIGEVEPGGYFEVHGRSQAETPLRHPRLEEGLLFYRWLVREDWQILLGNGHREDRSEILEDEFHFVAFDVSDGTGTLSVNPGGARFEGRRLLRLVEDVEPEPEVPLEDLSEDDRRRALLMKASAYKALPKAPRLNHRRTFELTGALQGDDLYVLGPTVPGASDPAIFQQRQQGTRPFVISSHTEAELGERAREGALIRYAMAAAAGFLGLLALAGLVLLSPETLEATLQLL